MLKGAYCEAEKSGEAIRIKFKPTHLIFNKSKLYNDNLLVETDEEEWNFLLQFQLKK